MMVVIANMIGTGVFTSLGFQLVDIRSGFVLVMLWIVGGLTALCGAVTYAELGAALPRSGGEYNFLSRIYHPGIGFISGWISATIGFAAPTALAAMTFGIYLSSAIDQLAITPLAAGLVVTLTAAHIFSIRSSANVQGSFTTLKVALIIVFCLCVWALLDQFQAVSFAPASGDLTLVASSAFAVSLIYVNYAYTGWNAATYLIDELEEPGKNLSRVLVVGTACVMALYLLLNVTFLIAAPMDAMRGQEEIGYIVAQHALGAKGATVMGVVLALLLISTVSAMTLAGPRVLYVIGQDFAAFRWLATTNRRGVPFVAIVFQSGLALAFIATGSFQSILIFAGFILGMNSFFTIAGVFIVRRRGLAGKNAYRMPLYPLPPLVFLGITGWTLVYLVVERPVEGLAGLAIIGTGAAFYGVTAVIQRSRQESTG